MRDSRKSESSFGIHPRRRKHSSWRRSSRDAEGAKRGRYSTGLSPRRNAPAPMAPPIAPMTAIISRPKAIAATITDGVSIQVRI